MKLVRLVFVLALFGLAAPLQASPIESDDLGVGVMLGSVAAVTAKKWDGTTRAMDFGVSSAANNEGQIYGSYLWHFPGAVERTANVLPYLGAGLGVGFNRTVLDIKRNVDAFARVPVGVAWYPQDLALGVFAEVVPSVIVVPAVAGHFDAGLGARYYF